MTTNRHYFKAGKYYVGDLCYIVSDANWDLIIDKTGCFGLSDKASDGWFEGAFEHKGRKCFLGSTRWGDGAYYDDKGREYFVDSGSLGIMPVEILDLPHNFDYAHIINFEKDFSCVEVSGHFLLGDIEIETE